MIAIIQTGYRELSEVLELGGMEKPSLKSLRFHQILLDIIQFMQGE